MTEDAVHPELERGRACYGRREWSEAYRLLRRADAGAELAAPDVERLATAAYLIGRDPDAHELLERAHHAWLEADEPAHAARSAFWLGLLLMFRGEGGRASGWLGRAGRLVEGLDCVERGYLLLPEAERQLVGGHPDAALETAARTTEIGERFGDPDLIACGRHLEGRSLLQTGDIPRGLALLDETMVAASGDELSPLVTGLVYCSVIEACQQVFALDRAREWTDALSRWCDRQPELVAFAGTCLVHRAEVRQLEGAWTEAMAESRRACERASQAGERTPPAAALYRQGEIHRLRGTFDEAEAAYREASRLGFEPQPGLALLRAAQNRTDVARAMMRRVLDAADDPLRRAALLPAYIEIALAARRVDDARPASAELDALADRYPTDVLRAISAQARGALALAEGRPEDALQALRQAFDIWRDGRTPYQSARTRALIARACHDVGDLESARLEIDAARAVLERLGAAPDLARLHPSGDPSGAGAPRLTPREHQVLREIATGKTNRAIAAELGVSERTVDRHVSNILVKLGVPSRAAATAYAYTHELL